MTLASEARSGPQAAVPRPRGAPCGACGAPLSEDQEWCLHCGTGRTVLHPTGSWRVPVALVAVIVLLALAAFSIALINLSAQANRSAASAAASSQTRAASGATATRAHQGHRVKR